MIADFNQITNTPVLHPFVPVMVTLLTETINSFVDNSNDENAMVKSKVTKVPIMSIIIKISL